MRALTVAGTIATLALLSGCAADEPMGPGLPSLRVEEAGHNATEHDSGVNPVAFEVQSACNDELIAFTGTDTYHLTAVGTPEALESGHSVHSTFQSHVRATGTGSESGATYRIDDIYQTSFNSPSPPAPQVSFTEHGRFRIVSDVAGLSFVGHFVFHGVALPSGEGFEVLVEVERVECRG